MKRCAPLLVLGMAACVQAPPPPASPTPTRSTTTISHGTTFGVSSGAPVELVSYRDDRGTHYAVTAPAARVWEVLPEVFQSAGISVATYDQAAHTMGNARLMVRGRLAGRPVSEFLSCGNGPFGAPLADSYQVEILVLSTLTPTETGTRVETRVGGTARNPSTGGGGSSCSSTGRLEHRLAAEVAERLKAPPR